MARPRNVVPNYRQHVGTGQAVVTLTGLDGRRRDIYLGPFGSDGSIIEFGRAIIEWKTGTVANATPGRLSINELILAYWKHAEEYYGASAKEVSSFRYALKPLKELFGPTPVNGFGPKSLKAVRDRFIEKGWSRQHVNRQVNRIRRVFKWGVAEEMVPAAVLHGLQSLTGLPYGRTKAPESPPVRPVADADVMAILPFLTSTVRAMVLFQRYTGCRPGEVVQLRLIDLDRSDPAVWWYRPQHHKTKWTGKEKEIAIGPKAQEAIRSMITTARDINSSLFSPQQAAAERNARKRADRKSKVQPSQQHRRATDPKKAPGEMYDVSSYRRAVTYGIKKARTNGIAVNHWHVNQLRHTRATELRELHGIESASAVLGHGELRTTEIYAEKSRDLARRVAAETG